MQNDFVVTVYGNSHKTHTWRGVKDIPDTDIQMMIENTKIVMICAFVGGFKRYANILSKQCNMFEKNGGSVSVFSGSLAIFAQDQGFTSMPLTTPHREIVYAID